MSKKSMIEFLKDETRPAGKLPSKQKLFEEEVPRIYDAPGALKEGDPEGPLKDPPNDHRIDRCHKLGVSVFCHLFEKANSGAGAPLQEKKLKEVAQVLCNTNNFVLGTHHQNLTYFKGEDALCKMIDSASLNPSEPGSCPVGIEVNHIKLALKVLNTIKKHHFKRRESTFKGIVSDTLLDKMLLILEHCEGCTEVKNSDYL